MLQEYVAGRKDEFGRLKKYRDDLHVFLVRPPRRRRHIARASAHSRARARAAHGQAGRRPPFKMCVASRARQEICAGSAEWEAIKDVEEVAKAKKAIEEADHRLASK